MYQLLMFFTLLGKVNDSEIMMAGAVFDRLDKTHRGVLDAAALQQHLTDARQRDVERRASAQPQHQSHQHHEEDEVRGIPLLHIDHLFNGDQHHHSAQHQHQHQRSSSDGTLETARMSDPDEPRAASSSSSSS